MSIHLCKSCSDEHVPLGHWIASLSNGETIYEDECPDECRCWVRLHDYCKENNLKITQMRWQYQHRTHVSKANADGYVLSRKMRSYGTVSSSQDFCGIGYINGDMVYITFVSVGGHSFREERKLSDFTEYGQVISNV